MDVFANFTTAFYDVPRILTYARFGRWRAIRDAAVAAERSAVNAARAFRTNRRAPRMDRARLRHALGSRAVGLRHGPRLRRQLGRRVRRRGARRRGARRRRRRRRGRRAFVRGSALARRLASSSSTPGGTRGTGLLRRARRRGSLDARVRRSVRENIAVSPVETTHGGDRRARPRREDRLLAAELELEIGRRLEISATGPPRRRTFASPFRRTTVCRSWNLSTGTFPRDCAWERRCSGGYARRRGEGVQRGSRE